MISGTRYRLTAEINRQLALSRDIERAQTEISTGKRVQAPSDDPVGAARISEIAKAQAAATAWKANLDIAYALAARADSTLASVSADVARAHELMLAGANGTMSAENRATVALELRSLADDIASLKDTRDARGDLLFPAGQALQMPVNIGVTITATDTREAVFESVPVTSGPTDLEAIIRAAADALVEPNPTLRSAAITASVDSLAASSRHVAAARGQQGARANRIDNLVERLAESGLQLDEERNAVEAADITEVVARLQSRQLTLEAAQAVFSRVNQSTLFDVLR